ncbi:ankyrin repeat domain-containing protein [Chryseobacterium balustinum]|uniref:ankyrin repeat domain-containing protein n=1 Tax=Chryseobacterium balustinum TaxID=246 RepID=UPI003CEAA2E3
MIIKEQLEELIAVLKEGNVDLFQKNEFGNTALHIACNPIYNTNVEIIKLLLSIR